MRSWTRKRRRGRRRASVRRLVTIAAALALLAGSGCAARIGPAEWEFWRGFNIEVDFPTRLCVGCLEVKPEPEAEPTVEPAP